MQEYHAQCTTENILTCVPTCNATHHGFELLANIDGTAFVLALMEDANIGTDLVVQPGQMVIISGDACRSVRVRKPAAVLRVLTARPAQF
eukprot:SAG22_NODE_99_length_20560_cov_128.669029_5_plen_90_part_00